MRILRRKEEGINKNINQRRAKNKTLRYTFENSHLKAEIVVDI